MNTSNVGSDGFTAVFKPMEQLRLAATIPATVGDGANWLNGDGDGEHDDFHFGAGAILDLDMFQISANLQNLPCGDDRKFGSYIDVPGFFGLVEGLNIGAGFTHVWGSDSLDKLISWAGLGYDDNLLNAYATYALGGGVNSA